LKKTSLFILLFILISCNDRKETSTIEKDVIPYKYRNYSNFQKKKYLDSIFNKLIFLNDDSLKIKSLFEICNQYYYHKDYISSIKTSKKAFDTASKLNDSLNIGRSLYYIGDCYLEYQKDSAYYYYKEAEKIFRKLNNKEKLALVLYNKSYLLFYEGNYIESEIEVIKALNCLKSTEKLITKYRCYSLQGSNHLELGEYDKAEEYFNLSADILKQMKREGIEKDAYYDYEITNTIDLCTAYDKKGEYKKSISALNEIVTKSNFKAYPKLKYFVYGNLAYSLMKDHQYALSNKYFKQALSLAKKENDELGYLYIVVDFGEFHLATKDTLKARELFNEALLLSKKLNNGKEILKSLDFLSMADKSNASNYKTEYIRINDSVIKKQRENREKFARIEYETGKVVEENKILSNKNILLLLGFTISIAIFLIVIVIREKISRKKEVQLIQEKKLADEELLNLTKEFQSGLIEARIEEQNRISKELHDGIVNQIYGIRMILGSLNNKDDEETQKKRFGYIKELQKLESEIRTLSHELNTDFSMSVGEFPFLIEQLIFKNNAIGSTNFSSTIQSSIDWSQYSSVAKINLYRIIQELLLNVNKYAEAENCSLDVSEINKQLVIVLKDDGKGFSSTTETFGIGLMNCKDRANAINAQIDIQSTGNAGTVITIKL
jgi:signal transduction histidine kinase